MLNEEKRWNVEICSRKSYLWMQATNENTVIKVAMVHVQILGGKIAINVVDTINNTMTLTDIISSN